MKCGDYEVLISAYADGELEPGLIPNLVNHIAVCDKCRQLYEETCNIQSSISAALSMHIETPDLTGSICSQIHPRKRLVPTWAWAAAAIIILIVGSMFMATHNIHNTKQIVVVVKQETAVKSPMPVARQVDPIPEQGIIGVRPDIMPEVKHKANSRKTKNAPIKQLPEAKKLVAKHEIKDPDQAEITVEYLTPVDPEDQECAKSLEIAPKIPTAGPEQRVVGDVEEIIINGRRVKRFCFRVVPDMNSSRSELPGEPQSLGSNSTYQD